MTIYAVLDTNVLVSAMPTRKTDAATSRVLKAVVDLNIVPLYNHQILKEYEIILHRKKFEFSESQIEQIISIITDLGISSDRVKTDEYFRDESDIVFYEVALSKNGAYVVTGNIKDFPRKPIVVTPSEMVQVLEDAGLIERL